MQYCSHLNLARRSFGMLGRTVFRKQGRTCFRRSAISDARMTPDLGSRAMHGSTVRSKSGPEMMRSYSSVGSSAPYHAFPQHLTHRRRRLEWFGLHPPIKKGKVSPVRDVPVAITRPSHLTHGMPSSHPEPLIHDSDSIKGMREACYLAAQLLDQAGALLEPGMSTEDIDEVVHTSLISNNAYPSPLMYGSNPFPKSICTSVNEVALHGIPDDEPLREGDVVSLDLVAYHKGFHGDTCRTYIVGDSSLSKEGEEARAAGDGAAGASGVGNPLGRREGNSDPWRARRLVRATKRALHDAIRVAGPGVRLQDIGEAVQRVVDDYGFDTVREFKGHGVGRHLHTKPLVNHFRNIDTYELRPGLTFTIEPMLVEKSASLVMWKDGWTASTKDGGLAAQFEHTLLVTDHGVEVLTQYDDSREPWWLREIPVAWERGV